MKKLLIALTAMVLFTANAQAATHPTCKKFFKIMDDSIAHLPEGAERKRLLEQWTPVKAKMVKQTQESQARACQNGLNSLRQMN